MVGHDNKRFQIIVLTIITTYLLLNNCPNRRTLKHTRAVRFGIQVLADFLVAFILVEQLQLLFSQIARLILLPKVIIGYDMVCHVSGDAVN